MPPTIQRPDLGGPFPDHVAVIMDGNGRWAESHGLRRVLGHREGIRSVRETVTECARMGVKSLTLYAFSVENWKRPRTEIGFLMKLLERFLVDERPTLVENDVRLTAIGRLELLPALARKRLEETIELTRAHRGLHLRLALSYGSRSELADALKRAAADARAGRLDPAAIDEETLRSYLYDPSMPDPDVVIRTAGELRLSNFLLWQASYAEIVVVDVCWPEFRRRHLLEALGEYARRVRKFGGLPEAERARRAASASAGARAPGRRATPGAAGAGAPGRGTAPERAR
jgi:undecaprenyl diphosphate synthase